MNRTLDKQYLTLNQYKYDPRDLKEDQGAIIILYYFHSKNLDQGTDFEEKQFHQILLDLKVFFQKQFPYLQLHIQQIQSQIT